MGARITSAQVRLHGFRARAPGLAAERMATLARLEMFDADLAEVSQHVDDGQVTPEAHVEELVRQVVKSGHGRAAVRALQQALAAPVDASKLAPARATPVGAGCQATPLGWPSDMTPESQDKRYFLGASCI